ncbi:MAG: sulfite exporter TauE/SafE family protein [Candidatus Sulfotelmatobacter sp.]
MTLLEFGVMFMLGLVSSLHCVQMCGPIVLSYSVAVSQLQKDVSPVPPLLRNHLAYNAGRILTYSLLGAIAGVAGGTLGLLGRLAGFSHILALVAGALMIVVGISMLGIIPSSLLANNLFRIPSSFLRRVGKLFSAQGAANRFLLGLALGFLPCGLIYAALFKAMATGSAFSGAVTMLAFGLGTAGALLVLGMFSSAIRISLNRWGSQLAAAGVTLMGILLLWRGSMAGMLMMGSHMHAHH